MKAWINKKTGMWLVLDSSVTHTKSGNTYSETDDLQKASILSHIPDSHVRRKAAYEPVEVYVYRKVTIK